MVARKPALRTKRKDKTLKSNVQANKDKIEKMETDDTSEAAVEQKKDKLHRVNKKTRRSRSKKKGRKLKLHLMDQDSKKKSGDLSATVQINRTSITGKKSSQIASFGDSDATHQWGITLGDIPKTWKGEISDVANKYKEFGLKAYGLARQSTVDGVHQVLRLFFDNEENMKKAIVSGPTELLGQTLTLRTDPVRMVYISGVPLNIDKESVISDLKESLGSSVYDISVPSNRKNGKVLGHALAYVFDETTEKDLLDNKRVLHLWDHKQHCCSKKDFFSRYVLNIVSGCEDKSEEVLDELHERIQSMGIEVAIGHPSKLYFLDEASAKTVQKKSGMMVKDRRIILSHSHAVRFVIKNIAKKVKKLDLINVFRGINAFNLKYVAKRCKATVDVPAEEVKKCSSLHQDEFFGRKLIVLQSGSEELKLSKEESRKRFREVVENDNLPFTPGGRLQPLVEAYQKLAGLEGDKINKLILPINNNKKKSKKSKKLSKSKFNNKEFKKSKERVTIKKKVQKVRPRKKNHKVRKTK